MAALVSLGCGDDSSPVAVDTDTDTDLPGTEGPGPSTSDDGTTSDNGTTGHADETGEDDSTGDTQTTGEVDDSGYRVVFTSVVDGTVRLYSATPDFEQIEGLTDAGPEHVKATGGAGPQLHADGRHLAFMRNEQLYMADVWTGEVSTPLQADTLHRFQWSPTEPVLAWTTADYELRSAAVNGRDEILFDLAGDSMDAAQISFAWGPLGDRILLFSRPEGAQYNKARMIDADGANPGTVGSSNVGHTGVVQWTAAGDQVIFVADVSPEFPGSELGVGDRDGFDVISHPSGNVGSLAVSGDRTRVVYLTENGMYSVNVDGTGSTLIGVPPAGPTGLFINDAGTWTARLHDGALTVTPTTLWAPTVVAEANVVGELVKFEPDGARLAYVHYAGPGTNATLWRVDGNGAAEVSHSLAAGELAYDYTWTGNGLRYAVGGDDGVVGIFHTQTGATPSFVPEPDERHGLAWVESADRNLLVVQTEGADQTGHLCTFDVSNPEIMVEIGCHETHVPEVPFMTIAAHPE
jgi:WD40 repeat protein